MEKGEKLLPISTIFCNLIFDFCVKTRTRFSLRDKRLFEITEVEITRVDCILTGLFPSIKNLKIVHSATMRILAMLLIGRNRCIRENNTGPSWSCNLYD